MDRQSGQSASNLGPDAGSSGAGQPWFRHLSSPILFLTISLALVGAYLALSIPIAVFPNTDFPRIVIGVDNGVMPIDQMLVTITRPIEESVNSVPGLQNVQSITSRGSAEVDLFFDWNSDMILTLQRVDAVVAPIVGNAGAAKGVALELTVVAVHEREDPRQTGHQFLVQGAGGGEFLAKPCEQLLELGRVLAQTA